MSRNEPKPPGRDDRSTALRHRRPSHCRRQDRARPAYRRDPDRQSRRHHLARARDARRRRSDRLRGYPRDAQAPRSLRHRHAAHALPRPQCGGGAAEAPAPARRRRRNRARLGRRHAADLRSGYQAGARRAGGRAHRHRFAGRLGAAGRADRRGPADRSVSSSQDSCRPSRPRGARVSPNLRASRRRSCVTKPDRGWRRRSPILPPVSVDARPPCAASSPKCMRRSGAASSRTLAQSLRDESNCAARSCSLLRRRRRRTARRRGRRCAAARGADAAFAQGCRRRSRRRDRHAAPRTLSARARAGEGAGPWRAALSRRNRVEPRRGRERVAAFRLGLSAESRAALFLIAKGYRIAARRWKTPFGEIDIVARRRRALVFVEVKARDAPTRGRSRDRARQAPHHRRRRALAAPASRRRATRHPLRRHAGHARQNAAAYRQRLRCQPLKAHGPWWSLPKLRRVAPTCPEPCP